MVELYNNQPIITPKDGKAIALQQYSTPCPIAFLMGEFLKNNNKACYKNGYYITSDCLYYEPTAGNGMLAIALPSYLTWYNELDEIRFDNLERNFSTIITKNDASVWKPDNQFTGVIMNPPFGSLTKSEYYTRKGVALIPPMGIKFRIASKGFLNGCTCELNLQKEKFLFNHKKNVIFAET